MRQLSALRPGAARLSFFELLPSLQLNIRINIPPQERTMFNTVHGYATPGGPSLQRHLPCPHANAASIHY